MLRSSAASRCTRTRRRRRAGPGTRWPRWTARASTAGPRGRGAGLDRFRTGPEGGPRRRSRSRCAHRPRQTARRALVIHDRDAHEEVLRISTRRAPRAHVLHCFSGDAAFARACCRTRRYLSFAGTVTFDNASPARRLAVTPLDQLLVETDAPYLTPMPHRGAPTPPSSCRTPCGPWPVSSPWTSRPSVPRCRPTPNAFTAPGPEPRTGRRSYRGSCHPWCCDHSSERDMTRDRTRDEARSRVTSVAFLS